MRSGGAGRVNLAVLKFLLAYDAVGGPGKGFQALGADLLAAVDTFSESALTQTAQGLVYKPQLPMAAGALAEEQLFLIRNDGLVGDVQGVIGYGLTALHDGSRHRFLDHLLMGQKLFLKAPCGLGVEGHVVAPCVLKFKQLGRQMLCEGFVEVK